MTSHTVTDTHFDGLTIRDQRGSSLVVERTHDNGRTVVWVAPPGTNDGPGVGLDDADRAALAGFLADGGTDLAAQLEAANAMCDELRERNEKLTTLAAAVGRWRAQFSKPSTTKAPRMAAVIDAYDALPNMESCGTCSSTAGGCPECRGSETAKPGTNPGGEVVKVAAERDRLYGMYAASQQALRSLALAYADATGKPAAGAVTR